MDRSIITSQNSPRIINNFPSLCVYVSVCATVLYEKAGDQIAHVKFTVLLQSGGTTKITGLPLPTGFDVRHVHVYVCMYMYACEHPYVRMDVCVCMCTCVCRYMWTHHVYMCMCMYAYLYVCVCTYTHTCGSPCYTCVSTRTHAYIHMIYLHAHHN